LLDDVDPEWRPFLQVWDGLGRGIRNAVCG
jgi:hypothetical protein